MTKAQKELKNNLKWDILSILDDYYKTDEYLHYEQVIIEFNKKKNDFVNSKLKELGYKIGEDYITFDGTTIYKGDVTKW